MKRILILCDDDEQEILLRYKADMTWLEFISRNIPELQKEGLNDK